MPMARPSIFRFSLITASAAAFLASTAYASDLTVGGGWGPLDQQDPTEQQSSLAEDLAVQAEDMPLALATSTNALSDSALTIGYTLPALGTFTVDVSSADVLPSETVATSLSRTDEVDVYGAYSTSLLGGEVGVFGGYTDSRSAFTLEPTISRTVGASVGYAGFYLRGAYEDAGPDGLLEGRRAWQAGLGYGSDDFDVRVTYVQSAFLQGSPTELEGKQWMIGGLVQLTPSILLNANAFIIDRELVVPTVEPPGAGARVGVQLRF